MNATLVPLVHNHLPDITEVSTIDASDFACLNEIKAVLLKHQKAEKFGVNLLHKPFEIEKNEMLVETIHLADRTLITRPVIATETQKKNLVQTVWCFSSDESLAKACESFCPTTPDGAHYGYKDHYPA